MGHARAYPRPCDSVALSPIALDPSERGDSIHNGGKDPGGGGGEARLLGASLFPKKNPSAAELVLSILSKKNFTGPEYIAESISGCEIVIFGICVCVCW